MGTLPLSPFSHHTKMGLFVSLSNMYFYNFYCTLIERESCGGGLLYYGLLCVYGQRTENGIGIIFDRYLGG